MQNEPIKKLPRPLMLLRTFYALNTFLFFATSIIFFNYIDIIILGKVVSPVLGAAVRSILIILPLYLVFAIYRLKKEACPLAITYHLFFIINAGLTIPHIMNKNLKLKPLLEITLKPDYKTNRITDLFGVPFQTYLIQGLGILIGLTIIIYLVKKRDLFTA